MNISDDVFEICNAYESGFGHGLSNRGLPNPYKTSTKKYEAWSYGYSEGFRKSNDYIVDDSNVKLVITQLDIQSKVIDCISNNLSDAKISLHTKLPDIIDFDSLSLVELVMMIEEEFNIEITDETILKFKTVDDVCQEVYNLTNKR